MRKIILLGSTLCALTSCGQDTTAVVKKPVVVKKFTKPVLDSTKLTKELLVEYLLARDVKHPQIAYAIIRQESNMCSDLFKSNNNLFGMRQPVVRPTKSKGRKNGFAHFEKWQHSVDDYKLYLEFVQGHKMSSEAYLRHLDRSYAHAGYSKHISRYFDEYKSILENL